MAGRSLRSVIGFKQRELVRSVLSTRGNLERVTVMPVVRASGDPYKTMVVFPGKQPHFRRVNGRRLTRYIPIYRIDILIKESLQVSTPQFFLIGQSIL